MIVECPACSLRYDVTGRPPGTRARCRCGAVFDLPEPSGEARVLACPRCGGNVGPGATSCTYCAAELLVMACPRCFARVFHGAQHCGMCGAKVTAPAVANPDGTARRLRCPRCDGEMVARLIDSVLIDECESCHGIWLDTEALVKLLDERDSQAARHLAPAAPTTGGPVADPGLQGGRMYLRCPECDVVMNRRNFARASGVIVDQCKAHGTWFDRGELPRVISFVASGGLGKAHQRELEDLARGTSRSTSPGMLASSDPLAALGPSIFERRSPVLRALGMIGRSLFKS